MGMCSPRSWGPDLGCGSRCYKPRKKVTKQALKKRSNGLKGVGGCFRGTFHMQTSSRGAWTGSGGQAGSRAREYVVLCGSLPFRGAYCLFGQTIFPIFKSLQHLLKSCLCLVGKVAALCPGDLSRSLEMRNFDSFCQSLFMGLCQGRDLLRKKKQLIAFKKGVISCISVG